MNIRYNHLAHLDNGADISAPFCNYEHKFHAHATVDGKTVGILFKILDNNDFDIILVYRDRTNYRAKRYTDKYKPFVKTCVDEMAQKAIVRWIRKPLSNKED